MSVFIYIAMRVSYILWDDDDDVDDDDDDDVDDDDDDDDDDDVRFYWKNTLSWNFILPARRNNIPWAYMSHHSETLSWLPASPYLLFLLNVACLAER